MKRNTITRFAVCVAFALAASATLPAAELTHRWSFKGDYSDSVGGVDAVKCGTYVSLYGGRVHMGYGACSHGTGYVDLGTNMLDTTTATIEIWARHDGVESWSRVFDYGADTANNVFLSWTFGTTLSKNQAGSKVQGAERKADYTTPYEIGVDYYIAATFEQQGDGATLVKWQRRDAATGELLASGSLSMAGGINSFVNPVLYLGHSQYDSDSDALAAYDEVRVWRGVLTDAQLAVSAAAGPDATIIVAADVPQFTPAEPPEPPAQRAAVPNGGFRMMTYNIQYCYDEASTIIPDRTAARIIAENPDFCCVNEVRDSEAHPEATVLAKLTGMHKTFGTNLLLSREEPISSESFALPTSSAGWGTRYCLISEFTNFCVAVTHLDVARESAGTAEVQASNAVSFAAIRDRFAHYTKPIFLCGDWNTRPDWDNMAVANEFLEILSPTNGVRTYHGHRATGGSIIDYIAVDKAHRGDFFVQRSFVVDDIVTSDHNPVIVELYCRPAVSTLGWVDESFLTTGRTGAWTPSVAWNGGTWTAELGRGYAFTPTTPSGGNLVTMTTTMTFDCVPMEATQPKEGAQGGLCLGTNGCFQVWVGNGEQGTGNGWIDVEAGGVTPEVSVEYAFRFTFDYTSKTYGVEVQTVAGFTRLREKNPVNPVNPVQNFPLATPGSKISRIRFDGSGEFRSLLGEWTQKVHAFMMHIF